VYGDFLARRLARFVSALVIATSAASCSSDSHLILTDQASARSAAARLETSFSRGNEAAHRAVLADTDDQSAAAVKEAEQATQVAQQAVDQLRPLLVTLNYTEEVALVDQFLARFAEVRKLDAEIFPLAVENTNLKAQRLAFGPGRESAEAFTHALAVMAASSKSAEARALVNGATAAVLEIQVLQSRHNAEADDGAMDRMEARMKDREAAARVDLARLRGIAPRLARSSVDTAALALDQFMQTNSEVVQLSRRNSNVRSLALTLGRRRTLVAECDDLLRTLGERVSGHEFKATR
jgi:hypothetical protein